MCNQTIKLAVVRLFDLFAVVTTYIKQKFPMFMPHPFVYQIICFWNY